MSFLRNAWYVANWSAQVTRELQSRTILCEPVVLYRTESGEAVALADRCPHRFVPLSRGKLKGDIIECTYHGLCFNQQGVCTFNPHGNGVIPKAARVKSYPIHERDGIVWIWMGEQSLADTTSIPDFPQFGDPVAYTAVYGYLHVSANYQLISDNLLDLTHGQYIHPMFVNANGKPQDMLASPAEERTVWAKYRRLNSYPNQYFQMHGFPGEALADTHNEMRWNPPGSLLLDVGITKAGAPRGDGFSIPTAHLLTPETETTTHYFWSMARDFRRDDTELSKRLLQTGTDIFTNEDKPAIEAQQRSMKTETDLFAMNPVLLSTDGPSVRARRMLSELVHLEGRESQPNARTPEVQTGS